MRVDARHWNDTRRPVQHTHENLLQTNEWTHRHRELPYERCWVCSRSNSERKCVCDHELEHCRGIGNASSCESWELHEDRGKVGKRLDDGLQLHIHILLTALPLWRYHAKSRSDLGNLSGNRKPARRETRSYREPVLRRNCHSFVAYHEKSARRQQGSILQVEVNYAEWPDW